MKTNLSGNFTGISGLFTDFYELVMVQTYFLNGEKERSSCFDYFFRRAPFKGSYAVFTGLETFLSLLEDFTFSSAELSYLQTLGFKDSFLEYLENFRFRGNIHSFQEGEIVFPLEPIMRVEGNIIENQLIETLLLNTINYQTLIATKAARIRLAAGHKVLLSEFGLRRAPSSGGLFASRAAVIGGFDSTSNVQAAQMFGLKASGTMAHSFIQRSHSELEAFRQFARYNADQCILLVDTYDTLKSGIPNAITAAREMEKEGHKLKGIRLDSGNPDILSHKARKMLDDAGLSYVKIAVSNELDEETIHSLHKRGAPIDFYGVGTNLVTGKPDSALDGVYKLCAVKNSPKMKLSENHTKMNFPGIKTVRRFYDKDKRFYFDGILLAEEETTGNEEKLFDLPHDLSHPASNEVLMHPVMEKGERTIPERTAGELAEYVRKRIKLLPEKYKSLKDPDEYIVIPGKKLKTLRNTIVKTFQKKEEINHESTLNN